jgi:hypothetical protein
VSLDNLERLENRVACVKSGRVIYTGRVALFRILDARH